MDVNGDVYVVGNTAHHRCRRRPNYLALCPRLLSPHPTSNPRTLFLSPSPTAMLRGNSSPSLTPEPEEADVPLPACAPLRATLRGTRAAQDAVAATFKVRRSARAGATSIKQQSFSHLASLALSLASPVPALPALPLRTPCTGLQRFPTCRPRRPACPLASDSESREGYKRLQRRISRARDPPLAHALCTRTRRRRRVAPERAHARPSCRTCAPRATRTPPPHRATRAAPLANPRAVVCAWLRNAASALRLGENERQRTPPFAAALPRRAASPCRAKPESDSGCSCVGLQARCFAPQVAVALRLPCCRSDFALPSDAATAAPSPIRSDHRADLRARGLIFASAGLTSAICGRAAQTWERGASRRNSRLHCPDALRSRTPQHVCPAPRPSASAVRRRAATPSYAESDPIPAATADERGADERHPAHRVCTSPSAASLSPARSAALRTCFGATLKSVREHEEWKFGGFAPPGRIGREPGRF
ncbi:hypothetical protein B0H15DRAFT_950751 [Mycena belliarum]|uniref:Uncharacterized protein n=1 Tax=Mycena belliarum TaxID=1033014 RepID=A0AAD6U2R2_9AGAR|nr:hypothetical protein B0H15DRAFT_950751 [Mycena belliae]